MSDSRTTKFLGGIVLSSCIAYGIIVAILLLLGHLEISLKDFGAYYNAAVRFQQGEPIYKLGVSVTELSGIPTTKPGYVYPPLTILLFLPLSHLPFWTAAGIWSILNLITLLAGTWALLSELFGELSRRQLAVLIIAVAGFYPVKNFLYIGQITGILVGILCFTAVLVERARRHKSEKILSFCAGGLTAFVIFVKPFYAPAAAFTLRDRMRLLGVGVGFLGLYLISFLLLGMEPHAAYLDILSTGHGRVLAQTPPSEWLHGRYRPLYILGDYQFPAQVALCAIVAGVAIVSRKRNTVTADRSVYVLGVLTVMLVEPSPTFNVLVGVIPAVVLISCIERQRRNGLVAIPLIMAIFVHVHRKFVGYIVRAIREIPLLDDSLASLLPWVQPALWGILLLFGLAIYRLINELTALNEDWSLPYTS